ncbi:MAG: cytochrome c biogenesis protein CcdA [Candidatus Bathyarchaeota archaeon]|nr:MAG: cytochrome c biogenesis protein CcdA [Candidatus Bathyarchaeota archaeon]
MALDVSGVAFYFTAGALALLSPCGFPMLPGYISYYMGTKTSLEKAVSGGFACTLGLLTVFSAIGIGVSALGSFVSRYIPFLEIVAGAIVIFMGITMIMEIRFPAFFTISKAPKRKGLIGVFFYGVAYGLATLSCSAPIFFSILFYAVAAGGPLDGIIAFVVYALGMGLPIIVATVFVVKAKRLMLRRIVKVMPWVQKISGLGLIVVGIYLICFYYQSFYVT